MGDGTGGPLNGYAFPPEPDDGWCEPDSNGWVDYIGLVLGLLVVIGLIIVGVRVAIGLLP